MTIEIPSNNALTINRIRCREGRYWHIESAGILTDAEAAAITFRAAPADVVLGEYLEVEDVDGIRIGNLATAQYTRPLWELPYVQCTIKLL